MSIEGAATLFATTFSAAGQPLGRPMAGRGSVRSREGSPADVVKASLRRASSSLPLPRPGTSTLEKSVLHRGGSLQALKKGAPTLGQNTGAVCAM